MDPKEQPVPLSAREKRLAEALRRNLRLRKAAARNEAAPAEKSDAAGKTGPKTPS
jgi:hypothetical protein